MEKGNERDLEDIKEILSLAKLNEADVKPVAQTIYFSDGDLYENNYKLLQLDSHLIKEVEEGNSLYIKGDDNDEVMVFSENQSFHVTSTETSNSLLLVNNMKFNETIEKEGEPQINKVIVHGIFYEYLEAVVCKPHTKRLYELLQNSVYKGPEFEYQINLGELYTYEQLNEKIQASTRELKKALESLNVVTLDGKIRMLDFEYHFRVLSYMLKLIDENSWELDEIDYEITMDTLTSLVPREVLDNLFDSYTEESKVVDGLQLYRYKEEKVCTFFAEVLLRGAGKFNLNEFLQAWKDSVPEGMIATEDMLYEIAVIDRESNPNVIQAFDHSTLPDDINDRFKVLFEVKQKWTVPEISPYIRSLTNEKVDVYALLAKHARASKINGVKYYSAKHGN